MLAKKPSSKGHKLGIEGIATIPLPIPPSLHLNIPGSLPALPFLISLLPTNASSTSTQATPIARAHAMPEINLDDPLNPNVRVAISGIVLPLSKSSFPLLSNLVSNYLSALPSPVLITSLTAISMLRIPPVVADFPAPPERPKIIRHVTIQNMRVSVGSGGTALAASGTIIAEIQLPPQMKGIIPLIDVRKVWPDALVYDGDPPPVEAVASSFLPHPPRLPVPRPRLPHIPWTWPATPEPAPLPDPLPEKAFARISPPEWLNATVLPHREDDPEGMLRVYAHFSDIPFEVLPGRDAVFRSFVSKVCNFLLSGTASKLSPNPTVPFSFCSAMVRGRAFAVLQR